MVAIVYRVLLVRYLYYRVELSWIWNVWLFGDDGLCRAVLVLFFAILLFCYFVILLFCYFVILVFCLSCRVVCALPFQIC